jgi:hypothetical protein
MDLLVLESTDDDPVVKSSVKGLGSVTTVTTRASTPSSNSLGRSTTNQSGPGTLTHKNTSTSIASNGTSSSGRTLVPNTVLDGGKDERSILYPFKVKHLGKAENYTLYAPSSQNRQEWCTKIIEAKTKHARSLFSQNAEPFRLRVIADSAFAYEGPSDSQSILIEGTPLERAVREVENSFNGSSIPPPVSRTTVNCATSFFQGQGVQKIAIGTDYGVFITDQNNPRGWVRVSVFSSLILGSLLTYSNRL